MKLTMEPRPVLAICLNPAWTKRLIFEHLSYGDVNRAAQVKECGGGKGVNVVRVFRMLGLPITLASFAGGETGRRMREEICSSGAGELIVDTVGVTRTCITTISLDDSKVSELIEPSCTISAEEQQELADLVASNMSGFGAVVFSGSVASGISPEYCANLVKIANDSGVSFVLDACKNIERMLEAGVTLLKINVSELAQLADGDDTPSRASKLMSLYPKLKRLAVTDGAEPAMLFIGNDAWRISVPHLDKVCSPIGAGDCATAIFARRISEGIGDGEYSQAFAEALACASASCLTDEPSIFNTSDAEAILKNTIIQKL